MAFFWPATIQGRCLVPADILLQFYPWKALYPDTIPHNRLLSDAVVNYYPWMCSLQNAFFHGEWPLWNPHSYCGSPLAANMASAAFHPFNLFFLVMPVEEVSTLLPFLRLFLAGMGIYVLLRTWRVPWGGSLVGGLIYTFCGVHIVWLSNYPNTNITVLMPWIFLCLDRIVVGKHWVWTPALAALSAIQLLGGHPESSFHLYVAAFPYVLWRLYGQWRTGVGIRALSKRVCLLVCGGILALCISAFQLFPFLEYLPLTARYQETIASNKNMLLYLDFGEVFKLVGGTLFSPDFHGNPVDGNYWGFANYNEQNAHITVCGFMFALLSIVGCRSKRGLKRVLGVIALVSFLIVIRTPGIFELVVSLPLFRLACNHRLIFVFAFCAALLAALAATDNETGRGPQVWKVAIVAVALAVSAAALHFSTDNSLSQAQHHYRQAHLLLFFVFLVVATALAMIGRLWPRIGHHIPLILSGAVILEVFVWGINYNTFIERTRIFPTTPMLEMINSRSGIFRVVGLRQCLLRGSEQVYGFDSIIGMDPMKLASYEQIRARISGPYEAMSTPGVMSARSPWLDFLNVRYIATEADRDDADFAKERFSLIYDGQDGKVYENHGVLPRAFWAREVITVDSQEEALAKSIMHEDELGNTAIIEQAKNVASLPSGVYPARNSLPIFMTREADRMVLKVDVNEPAYLVLSEVYYPGWGVRLDGEKAPLLRANSAFLAVLVPKGIEEVEFYYAPESFKAGWVLSACGILVTIMIGTIGLFSLKRKGL